MSEQEIDLIGKEISLAYKFYQGYGYFLSTTVAQWLGFESLPNWKHQTILDLIAIDILSEFDRKGNKQAQQYMMFFQLHGTYTGRQTILASDLPADIETMFAAIKLQKAIAPAFIREFEV
ncbi:hypothetical protein I8748_22735 [Nostoc sp. CENA67]|uniref:Uncharacterized protein n=1 Tax=Amazonocrinis nigriterrae CENA67 TaxID=2794033 RepID=A0A8J7HWV2_9NOST|nr:hypothetical protein [Amazonocrinis nigriterrae]MBH8564965.1 hypothetical protein [Amazonocrinis nigriterrae CENA67]